MRWDLLVEAADKAMEELYKTVACYTGDSEDVLDAATVNWFSRLSNVCRDAIRVELRAARYAPYGPVEKFALVENRAADVLDVDLDHYVSRDKQLAHLAVI